MPYSCLPAMKTLITNDSVFEHFLAYTRLQFGNTIPLATYLAGLPLEASFMDKLLLLSNLRLSSEILSRNGGDLGKQEEQLCAYLRKSFEIREAVALETIHGLKKDSGGAILPIKYSYVMYANLPRLPYRFYRDIDMLISPSDIAVAAETIKQYSIFAGEVTQSPNEYVFSDLPISKENLKVGDEFHAVRVQTLDDAEFEGMHRWVRQTIDGYFKESLFYCDASGRFVVNTIVDFGVRDERTLREQQFPTFDSYVNQQVSDLLEDLDRKKGVNFRQILELDHYVRSPGVPIAEITLNRLKSALYEEAAYEGLRVIRPEIRQLVKRYLSRKVTAWVN